MVATLTPRLFAAAIFLAVSAAPCAAQPALMVEAPPALSAWTNAEFAAFTRATGIGVQVTRSGAGADVLIAPAPFPQMAEHAKLTLPYIPRETAHIPANLKDEDGDWTALALTHLALTAAVPSPERTASDAVMLLRGHASLAMPPGTPALLMTLAPNPQAAIAFPANPSGGRVTIAIPYFIARLKAGRQPDEAAKLIDFLLAAPAQRELPVLAWALPARTDIIPADPHYKMINKLLQKVAIYVPNWHQARKMLGG